ncbi:AMP-binding protein [Streptomyces sp. M19]
MHEILIALTTGATLHLVPEELRVDPDALLAWMREHRVVQGFLPPSYVKWIHEAPKGTLDGLVLRQLMTGIEALPEEALHHLRRSLPGLRLDYGYGPTETTVYCTVYTDPGRVTGGPRSAGRARACGCTCSTSGSGRCPGAAGEIYLSGASLTRGIWAAPT